MPGVSARGKENIRVPTCPESWSAGRKILNVPEVAAHGKENTQHARGVDLRDQNTQYARGFNSREEEGNGLNMPGVLSRGKKKIGG